MFDKDKWQEIFDTIRKHKLRTLLTALGVWWGIFMLIVLMGAGTGLQNGVFSMFGSHARNSMYMWTRSTTIAYKGFQPGRNPSLTMADIDAIRSNFGEAIQDIAPRMWVPSGEIKRGEKSGSFDVRGDGPDFINIQAMNLTKGRFINPKDVQDTRKICVIGKRVKEVLFEDEEAIGKYLTMAGSEYMVVGEVASDRSDEDQAQEDNQTIHIPITTAQRVRNRPDAVNWFGASINEAYDVYEYEEKIAALMRERHNIHPDDDRAIGSDNVAEEFDNISGLFIGIKVIIWIVGIGSLLAGIIGVSNIMLIIVKERTKEIGVRKALGATPKDIISMILLESVFITTFAGYIGLVSSVGVVWLLKIVAGEGIPMFSNPQINMSVGIGALILLTIAGAIAGLIPALNAANIPPVVALRDE
ncbi:MAG: putative ABC transport system permease protein [Saprospiraceae bacterium]|jgi:putative ABC transport system permease protein